MTHRRFLIRTGLALLAGAAAAGISLATIFNLSNLPPSSIKVERITPDMMFSICGFEQQDQPFFLDDEYRRAIFEYGAQLLEMDPLSSEAKRIEGLREGLIECRESDRNKRYVKRANRSCKALVRNHKAASERAWALNGENKDGTLKHEIMSWGERFREPLKRCLERMRCRYDNKQDMEEALAVYREVVDEMSGWILDVKGADDMKICGATIRDLKRWCTVEQSTSGNTTQSKDICTDAKTIKDAINLLQSLRRMPPGGWPKVNAGGAIGGGTP